MLHLLDDFLVVDYSSSPSRCISVVRDSFRALGVPLSEEKTLGPLTSLEFLGIQLDSRLMCASPPEEKLVRMRAMLASAAGSGVAMTKRDLLSLLGNLNFGRSWLACWLWLDRFRRCATSCVWMTGV